MRRAACVLTPALILVLVLGSGPVQAVTDPVINVQTHGVEICPQSVCGVAIFVGIFFGQVGNNHHAFGTFIVAANHGEPLPEPGGDPVPLTGVFQLRVGLQRFRGVINPPGMLSANQGDTFTIESTLLFTSGAATGTAEYCGLLDHNVFPPTVTGPITQVQTPPCGA